ncbi:MAG: OmpA family protein [Saprospiraceae bacterium]
MVMVLATVMMLVLPTLPASNQGCPEVQSADLEKLDFAMQNVRFRTGSDQILQQSYPIMDEIAEIMSRYPNYNLTISGYTDNVGNDVSNQALSENRAKACYQYLLVKNIARNRMSYAGYGETNPIDTNDTPAGRARNRRVEFKLVLK